MPTPSSVRYEVESSKAVTPCGGGGGAGAADGQVAQRQVGAMLAGNIMVEMGMPDCS